MKSGKCPKCGSNEIYFSSRSGQDGNFIIISHSIIRDTRVYLSYYACGQCNYFESYLADDEAIQDIRKHWPLLNPRKSKRKNDE